MEHHETERQAPSTQHQAPSTVLCTLVLPSKVSIAPVSFGVSTAQKERMYVMHDVLSVVCRCGLSECCICVFCVCVCVCVGWPRGGTRVEDPRRQTSQSVQSSPVRRPVSRASPIVAAARRVRVQAVSPRRQTKSARRAVRDIRAHQILTSAPSSLQRPLSLVWRRLRRAFQSTVVPCTLFALASRLQFHPAQFTTDQTAIRQRSHPITSLSHSH